MVYISSWDEFVERSIQLFKADPVSSRYVMKYRHCDGKLVLKVTDNRELFSLPLLDALDLGFSKLVSDLLSAIADSRPFGIEECLKFKTDQAQDAKKMEKLNNIFFTLMARGPTADITEVTGKEQPDMQPSKKGRGRRQ